MPKKSIKGILKNTLHLTENKKNSSISPCMVTPEEVAAIGLAIQLYLKELLDHETLTLTIQQVTRMYSPWSSKIYGVTSWPRFR